MNYENIQFQWCELYEKWKDICELTFADILKPINVRDVKVLNYKRDDSYFFGYDWVSNVFLKERIDYVSNRPVDFLHSSNCLNKGTLQTLEHLVDDNNNIELLASIWIYAYTKDLLEMLPREWRGDPHRLLRAVNNCASMHLKETGIKWHHAMKKLLPDSCISHILLGDMNPKSEYVILELAAINVNYILVNYTAVRYDSRDRNVLDEMDM